MKKESTNNRTVLSAKGGGDSPQKKTNISSVKFQRVFWFSVILLIFTFVTSLALGRYAIPFDETVRILLSKLHLSLNQTWNSLQEAVVVTLRLPRAIAAVVIGAALALSGATYQSIFKNPMVSPDLLGVSAGACVGAATAMLLGMGGVMIQVFAFAAGLGAVAITIAIPRLIRNKSTVVLVLAGIVVGSLMGSILNIIKFVADTDSTLAEITYWTMGSVATVSFDKMVPVLPTIIIPAVIILLMRFRLNVLSLGDNEARTLGINIQKTRNLFIICSTLITASCVCMSGTIGWVGLVIPHVARMMIGPDNKRMLPVAMIFGGIFLLLIDTLCRTITAAELRLGILTGIIGAPFFIFILLKQRRSIG